MKQLEHVLKRVRVGGRPLSERQYAVARAIAERTIDPDRGAQLAITEIAAGAYKQRSTVKTALGELVSLDIIYRSKPAGDARHATHIFRFHQLLIDQSEKSRPYLGPKLVFPNAQVARVKVEVEPAIICVTKSPEIRMNPQKKAIPDGQPTAGQELTGNYRYVLHAPAPLSLPPTSGAFSPSPSPAPGGGGACKELDVRALKESSHSDFGLVSFFNFFAEYGLTEFETKVHRRKKDDVLGGMIKAFDRSCETVEQLAAAVQSAAVRRFEIKTRSWSVLLVDDLCAEQLELVMQSGLAVCVIETSPSNFQALFCGEKNWTLDQIRATQRRLSRRFGGDRGALSGGQLHRLPGSLNLKNGGCFETRLFSVQFGARAIEGATEIQADNPATLQALDKHGGVDQSESAEDFRRVLKMMHRRTLPAEIEAVLLARCAQRNRHGNHADYTRRTIARAQAVFRPDYFKSTNLKSY